MESAFVFEPSVFVGNWSLVATEEEESQKVGCVIQPWLFKRSANTAMLQSVYTIALDFRIQLVELKNYSFTLSVESRPACSSLPKAD